jgi:hypothetical protein
LRVSFGTKSKSYVLTASGGGDYSKELTKGFTKETIEFVATSQQTLISFIEIGNTSGGNNDPMIDNIALTTVAAHNTKSDSLNKVDGGSPVDLGHQSALSLVSFVSQMLGSTSVSTMGYMAHSQDATMAGEGNPTGGPFISLVSPH